MSIKSDDMCIHFDTVPALDRQTDGIGKTISHFSVHCMLRRNKNVETC